MAGKPYSRMYWALMDDPKFDGIREDPRLFGAWALLLLYADMAYPAPTYRPPFVGPSAFRRLVAAGLVDELSGKRYRIHGLAFEREERTQSARNAAAFRWRMPSKSKAEQEQTRAKRTNTVEKDPLLREIHAAVKAREKDDA
jgi:hypothetical protein